MGLCKTSNFGSIIRSSKVRTFLKITVVRKLPDNKHYYYKSKSASDLNFCTRSYSSCVYRMMRRFKMEKFAK